MLKATIKGLIVSLLNLPALNAAQTEGYVTLEQGNSVNKLYYSVIGEGEPVVAGPTHEEFC